MLSQNYIDLRRLKENIPYYILSGALYVLRHKLTTENRKLLLKRVLYRMR